MILFCPHCEEIEEILGEPRKLECNTCGAVLENCDPKPGEMDPDERFEITAAGVVVLLSFKQWG